MLTGGSTQSSLAAVGRAARRREEENGRIGVGWEGWVRITGSARVGFAVVVLVALARVGDTWRQCWGGSRGTGSALVHCFNHSS